MCILFLCLEQLPLMHTHQINSSLTLKCSSDIAFPKPIFWLPLHKDLLQVEVITSSSGLFQYSMPILPITPSHSLVDPAKNSEKFIFLLWYPWVIYEEIHYIGHIILPWNKSILKTGLKRKLQILTECIWNP